MYHLILHLTPLDDRQVPDRVQGDEGPIGLSHSADDSGHETHLVHSKQQQLKLMAHGAQVRRMNEPFETLRPTEK